MSDRELAYMDLVDVARAIAAKEVSSTEVTRAMLERIASIDGQLGSYVTLMADTALREADAADVAIARGQATAALSLPAGFSAAGAPFGFQLASGLLNENALSRAGHVYQQATDWHRRQPQQFV